MVAVAVLENGIIASPSEFWYVQNTSEKVLELVGEAGLAPAICGSFT
jgi:hypothetical protein